MRNSTGDFDLKKTAAALQRLETRIARIESELNIRPPRESSGVDVADPLPERDSATSADSLEFRIGEFWFARVGIVVLGIGLAFLLTLPYKNIPAIVPGLAGYALTGVVLGLSHLLRNSYVHLSRYLFGSGLVLLFFATMRLHFFSEDPLIAGRHTEVALLLAVVALTLYLAIRRNSLPLTALCLFMGYVAIAISGEAWLIFSEAALFSALTVYLRLRHNWPQLLAGGLLLTYLTHFLWFINNPLLGGELSLQAEPASNLLFILLYVVIFASGNYLRAKDLPEDQLTMVSTFLNCSAGYGLFLLISFLRFPESMAFYHLQAALLFLLLAVAFWLTRQSRYSTFFYAMTGYGALSVAIVSRFAYPDFFAWLTWQSLIVISTAIWFRSRFIIVANFVIYILLFLAYLVVPGSASAVSLGFGVVALLSARIMNWQRDRLELKTEFMRTAYLAAAFVMIPYALYILVPGVYTTLAWASLAVFYYLLSRALNNKKYRWMALLTLSLVVLRVFLVDSVALDPVYRVISFLVVGLLLLVLSLLYARNRAGNSG